MIFIFLCFVVLAEGYLLWHFGPRWAGRRHGWQLLWRATYLIGTVRIAALWVGFALFQFSIRTYLPGIILLMHALPEIYLVKGLRDHTLSWLMAGSVLLSATSFVWAALLIWVGGRLQLMRRRRE